MSVQSDVGDLAAVEFILEAGSTEELASVLEVPCIEVGVIMGVVALRVMLELLKTESLALELLEIGVLVAVVRALFGFVS
jgi:hypothetical protein